MRTLAEIDELLALDKSLFGNPEWVEDGLVAKLVAPVVNTAGTVIGGLSFRLNAPIETAVQRGNAVLVLDNQPLQRLSYRPDHIHVNPRAHPTPAHLRSLRLPPDRSRSYSWANNRAWPPANNMRTGEIIDPEPPTLGGAYKLFLEACGISAYVPDPPHRPRLEF